LREKRGNEVPLVQGKGKVLFRGGGGGEGSGCLVTWEKKGKHPSERRPLNFVEKRRRKA